MRTARKISAYFAAHLGPIHPNVGITMMNLGNAYGALVDAEKQRELLERSLIIEEAHFVRN